ncbi:MAG: hypothetical protein ACR2PL_17005, partial [Dehalococcoidia bacterium]
MQRASTAARALVILILGFILLGGSARGSQAAARGIQPRTSGQDSSVPSEGRALATGNGLADQARVVSAPIAQASPGASVPGATTCGQWLGLPYLNRFSSDDGHGGCSSYTIAANVFLSLDVTTNPTYMEADVVVNTGGSMTIEPGVTIVASAPTASNAGLYVLGTLNMPGTAAQPVVMTSAKSSPAPADWAGIFFKPGSGGALSYTQISYTGRGFSGTTTPNASIEIDGASPSLTNASLNYGSVVVLSQGASPVISNSTFSSSGSSGSVLIWARDESSLPTLSNDTFPNLSTILVYPNNLSRLSGLTFANAGSIVEIQPGTLSVDTVWPNFGVPYALEFNYIIAAGTTVTIPAGLSLLGYDAGQLSVGGTLNLQGTASQPILDTGLGIRFRPGSGGALNFVRFSNFTRLGYAVAVDGTPVTISNSIFSNGGTGIQASNGANPTLTNDSFSGFTEAAIRLDFLPASISQDSGLSASGNGSNNAIVFGGGGPISGVWNTSAIGMSFAFVGGDVYVSAGAVLAIAAGASLTASGGIYVFGPSGGQAGGVLSASGTASQPVLFTSLTLRRGQWDGVAFRPGSTGSLSYTHLSYAGGPLYRSGGGC